MNIDVSKVVNDKLAQMKEDKVIENQIAKSIEETITRAVKDACEDYSFKHSIEKKVEDEVSEIAMNIGFTGYNQFIADTLETMINNMFKEDIKQKIVNSFNNLFVNKRESINLSEIVDKYNEMMNNLDDDDKQRTNNGNWYCNFEDDEDDITSSNSFKHMTITFALEKQETSKYSYSSYSSSDNKLVLRLSKYRDDPWTISRVEYEDEDLSKLDNLRSMSDFECFMAGLYFNKTKINVDINEDDVDTTLIDY